MKGTIQSILSDILNDRERGNITLRLWTGCICVSKECRRASVAEHNPDGTIKEKARILQRCVLRVLKKL